MSERDEAPDEAAAEAKASHVIAEVLLRLERRETVEFQEILEEDPTLAARLAPQFAVIRMLQELGAESRRALETRTQDPETRFQTGSRIGGYRIRDTLGAGGMGTVFLVVVEEETSRLAVGQEVALKLIHPHLLERPDLARRFRREAEAGLRVRHENVVSALDAGGVEVGDATLHYVVMERVEGRTLREVVDDLGRAPEAYVREIAAQVAAALAAIHAAGLVHRDLKPENVMVTADGRVRVMDLGMARLVDATVALTLDGQFAGSILYAAPEQLRGERATPAADLYALGILLFELLTGKRPFGPGEIVAAARHQAHVVPPYVTDHGVQATAFFTEVVHKLLSGDPDARFGSAAALREVLEHGEDSAWWKRRGGRLAAAPTRPRVPVERRTSFVGRNEELDRLRGFWQEAREGRGRTALLSGSTGVGKTRLVAELFREPASGHYLYTSFAATRSPIAVAETLAGHFGLADLEETLRRYLRPSPLLATRISRFARRELGRGEDAHLEREGLHAALAGLVRGMARERPVLWAIEDVQAAPPEALGLVLTLARAAEGERALILLTAGAETPEDDAGPLGTLESLERMPLGRMPAAEMAQLLEACFALDAADTPLDRQILHKADGTPGVLLALLHGLEQDGALRLLDDGRYEMEAPETPLRLPATLRLSVQANLSRLESPIGGGPEEGRRDIDPRFLLDLASVHGFAFDAYLLADVLEKSPITILRMLASIERRTGIVRASGRSHRFDQVLMRDVLYEDLAPDLRRRYHALLAVARERRDAVDPAAPEKASPETLVFLARHHVLGDHPESGRPYLALALEILTREGRDDESLALALSALEQDAFIESDAGIEVALHAASRLIAEGRRDPARDLAHRTKRRLEQLEGDEARAPYAVRMSRVLRHLDEWEEARRILEEALAVAGRTGNVALQVDALCALGRVAASAGDGSAALAYLERGVGIADEADDRTRHLAARRALGEALGHAGRHDEARSQHERCVTLARELSSPPAEIRATSAVGEAYLHLGRLADAMPCFQRAGRIAHEHGRRSAEARALERVALTLQYMGEQERALEQGLLSLALHRELGDAGGKAAATATVARAELMLGMRAESIGRYERLLSREEHRLPRSRVLGLRLGLTLALTWDGRFGPAEACLLRAREMPGRDAPPSLMAHALFLLARLYGILGRPALAHECVDGGFDVLSKVPPDRIRGVGFFVRGILDHAGGRRPEARVALGEALDLLRRLGDAPGTSAAQLALGELDLHEGDEAGAMRHAEAVWNRAKKVDSPHMSVASSALLARLDPARREDAEAALGRWGRAARVGVVIRAHARLGKLAGESPHRERVLGLLAHLAAHWPEADHPGFPASSPEFGPIAEWAGYGT